MKTLSSATLLMFLFVPAWCGSPVSSVLKPLEGQPFHYKAVSKGDRQKPAREQGKVMMFSEPMPNHQTVEVKAPVDYKGQNCWVIATTSEENNPNFGANPYEKKLRSKTITSYIAPDGQILYVETITRMGGNRNQNMETNLPAYETLNHFYGKWMLDLSSGYRLELGTQDRGVFITVEKEEKLGDRNCFVARVIKRMNGEVKSNELYWVDAERKIALKCISGGLTLELADAS